MMSHMISVSMQTSEIAESFDQELAQRLAPVGFQKCPAGHFTNYLAPDVSGHFGYVLHKDRRTSEVWAWPVAGVRLHAVERLLCELSDKEFDAHGSFTIGGPVGFLMPRLDQGEWAVDSVADVPRVAAAVVAACKTYVLPFMQCHMSLEDAVKGMSPEQLGGGHDGARLAVTYLLLGDMGKALQVVDYQLAHFAKGSYPGASEFRKLAGNLRDRTIVSSRHVGDRTSGFLNAGAGVE